MKKGKIIPFSLGWNKVLLLFFMLFMRSSFALVPLENLILGDFSDLYEEEKNDPLRNIYNLKDENKIPLELRKQLALYRGFINEGLNFNNSCKFNKGVSYSSIWEHDQAIRGYFTQMQFFGLDVVTRALSAYAKYFEFTDEEFERFTDSLIGNYCSRNISVISLKELRRNILVKFQKENNFTLPNITKNTLFASALDEVGPESKTREHEFYQTIKLFRNFCSWGGESDNARMLVPLLRNPFIVAKVAREMASLDIKWNTTDNTTYLEKRENNNPIYCSNLICRQVSKELFERKFPRAIGSQNVYDDFKRLYCEEFRDLSYVTNKQVPQIANWIKKESFDDEIFMQGQFIALLTGIPDFLLRADKFTDAQNFLRFNIDKSWNIWAVNQISNFDNYLYYEETLSIEKVDPRIYFNPYRPDFKVIFDINLGETDRINQTVGKIKTALNLRLPKSLLRWLRYEWVNFDPTNPKIRENLIKVLSKNIEGQIDSVRDKFRISPWTDQFKATVAKEILFQMELYKGDYFESTDTNIQKEWMKIPVILNYGPYALKYLNYEHLLSSAKDKDYFKKKDSQKTLETSVEDVEKVIKNFEKKPQEIKDNSGGNYWPESDSETQQEEPSGEASVIQMPQSVSSKAKNGPSPSPDNTSSKK